MKFIYFLVKKRILQVDMKHSTQMDKIIPQSVSQQIDMQHNKLGGLEADAGTMTEK